MKYVISIILAAAVFFCIPLWAQEADSVAVAQDAAKSWLALTDASE